jgi:hypothetical protein
VPFDVGAIGEESAVQIVVHWMREALSSPLV